MVGQDVSPSKEKGVGKFSQKWKPFIVGWLFK